MTTTYSFTEEQTGTLTGIIQDDAGNPLGAADLDSLTLTLTDQITSEVINSRLRQDVLNTNDVTLDSLGNLSWSIQTDDNIIVSEISVPGTIERHEILFEWRWDTVKYSNTLYYFDVIQVNEIGSVGGTIYGTVLGATAYFATRLNSLAWTNATNADRVSALTEATRLIDNLNYKGDKTSTTQALEFPRGGDILVPTNIQYAAYELAIRLLDGYDPDMEIEGLRLASNDYDSVHGAYHRGVQPEWVMAGIISPRAWFLLKPYLRDPRILVISREN
jgi:hypothetical protein